MIRFYAFLLAAIWLGVPARAYPSGAAIRATDRQTGTMWFYEGDTQRYRVVYVYYPRQHAVIAYELNSGSESAQHHSGELAATIFKTLHATGRL
jgi:hypothetical protein